MRWAAQFITLDFINEYLWSARQKGVAVVKPGKNQRRYDSFGGVNDEVGLLSD